MRVDERWGPRCPRRGKDLPCGGVIYGMPTRTHLRNFTLIIGALAVLALGADHLYEYAANEFSSVPTMSVKIGRASCRERV